MESSSLALLGILVLGIVATMYCYHLLSTKGPRGAVLSAAILMLLAGMAVARNGIEESLPLMLLARAMQITGAVGVLLGVVDLIRQRSPRSDAIGRPVPRHTPADASHREHVASPARVESLVEWLARLPLLWGGVACLAFYAMLSQKFIDSTLLTRYFASHPVEYIATAMFFVGMAALAMRLMGMVNQYTALGRVSLEPIPPGGQPVAAADSLLAQLAELPGSLQSCYLVRRLRDALEFVRRKDAADSLDQHLRHLEDLDLARMHAGYSLVRIVVWAIPILGFLGTVIGITLALTKLSPQALEQSLPEVTDGLGVAFDTTALALGLSMLLMFAKFCVERLEDRLLSAVDDRVAEELTGRFQQVGSGNDPNVVSIHRMGEQVIGAVEALANRQAEAWKSSIDATHQHWSAASTNTAKTLDESLRKTLDQHAQQLNDGMRKYSESFTANAAKSADRLDATTNKVAKRLESCAGEVAKLLKEGVTQHADRLQSNADHHAEKVTRAAQESVGRLREGLEKLAELLVEALQRHGEVLTVSEKELAEENRRHLAEVEAALGEAMVVAADRQEKLIRRSEDLLQQMQDSLVQAAGATVQQQEQLIKQGDVLLQVVGATGQIKSLENALNDNLAALGRTHNFEEMALNVSAAVQLLCARLGQLPSDKSQAVEIVRKDSISDAA